MNFTAKLTFLSRADDVLKFKTVGESTCVFLKLKKTKLERQQELHIRDAIKRQEGEERPWGSLAGASIKAAKERGSG